MSVTKMYRQGDTVRATKGDIIAQGPVVDNGLDLPYLILYRDAWLDIADAIADGWTVEIVKRAPIPIPTEPGVYRDTEGDFWVLSADGVWALYLIDNADAHLYSEDKYFPLTRLEEVE